VEESCLVVMIKRVHQVNKRQSKELNGWFAKSDGDNVNRENRIVSIGEIGEINGMSV
jgi:hypothetical protein